MAKGDAKRARQAEEARYKEYMRTPHTLEELAELKEYVSGPPWDSGRFGQQQIQKLLVTIEHLYGKLVKAEETIRDAPHESWCHVETDCGWKECPKSGRCTCWKEN